MDQIRKEQNDQYSNVLLWIIEDAKERADGLSNCTFDDWVPTSYGSIDPLMKHAHNNLWRGNRESLKKLINVLQEEVSVERDRELRLLNADNEYERKRIKFEVMKERCNVVDRLMQMLGPGSKFIDYLLKSVERSGRVNCGQTCPPPFGCEVVIDELSKVPLSVRKCYEVNVRRRS
ncbi:hypothetical protein ACHAXS_009733 [Conticribra weissflogii]